MAKARRKWQAKKPAPGNGARTTATKKYWAPTSNYEDVVFSASTTKYAALFQDVLTKLSLYVGTQNWKRSMVLSKAMEDQEIWCSWSPCGRSADGDLNNPMVDNIHYQADMTVYLSKKKRYDD